LDRRAQGDRRQRAAGSTPELVEPVLPPEEAPFIVKARHAIFYETLLEYLLRREEINRLVLAGQVTEQCILYSALDAHVRHFEVVVPTPAVAHIDEGLAQAAIRMMETNLHARLAAGPEAVLKACRAWRVDRQAMTHATFPPLVGLRRDPLRPGPPERA
jgi:nicotinamidase-related amidase